MSSAISKWLIGHINRKRRAAGDRTGLHRLNHA
ncbi:hypothetical protein ABIA85_009494 [Bradyrhizobium sp. LA6.10]